MMKRILTAFLMFIMISGLTSVAWSKCIVFNNFDTWSDASYIQNIKTFTEYSGRFEFKPFNNTTFNALKITDYELAFFPMGDEPLNAKSDESGTNVVITKIKEMIDSGKSVVIIGRKLLWWAFNPSSEAQAGKDPVSISFFRNELGVRYIGTIPTAIQNGSTTTFTEFIAKGAPKDPVGQGLNKFCNVKYGNPPNYSEPLSYYPIIDVFKKDSEFDCNEIDFFISGGLGPTRDTLVGIRMQIGKSKIVFISYGLENIAEDFQRVNYVKRILDWCLATGPAPGAQIEKLQTELQYSSVISGDKASLTAEFTNIGTETLVCDSVYIDDSLFEMGGFTITDMPKLPIIKEKGDTFRITVEFNPTAEQNYFAKLAVVSNSKISPRETVDLRGQGVAGNGPRITCNFPSKLINFEKTIPNQKNEKKLVLYNKGTQNLNITDGKVLPTGTPVYLDGFTKYVIIKPQDSLVLKVRFQPIQENQVYNGEIIITSNAVDNADFRIAIHGESDKFQSVENTASDAMKISINPNPAENVIFAEFALQDSRSITFDSQIMDLSGKLLISKKNNLIISGKGKIDFDISSLNSGIYFLQIKVNDSIYSQKFIIK